MVIRPAVAQWPAVDRSQDRALVTANAAIVLDGASPYLPVDVPTATYVDTLGANIADRLGSAPADELGDVVAGSIASTARALHLVPGNSPSSTVTIVRVLPDRVDVYALGDGAVYYGRDGSCSEVTDSRLADLGIPEHRQYRDQLAEGHGYGEQHQDLLRRLQREQRTRRNRQGGYWIAEADSTAGHHAVTVTVPRSQIAWAVIATDGAYKPMRHLGLDDWRAVAHEDVAGLSDLLERCRDWETRADPDGKELPRAKVSDDKTLVTITFE